MFVKTNKFKFLLSFTILFCLWGFFLQESVYSNNFLVYVGFLIILFLSIIVLMTKGQSVSRINKYVFMWLPYLLYTMAALLLQTDVERFSYWFVCFVIILVAQNEKISGKIPFKLFYYSGIVCLVGMWIQIIFPDFYNAYFLDIFNNSQTIKNWAQWGYGYAGFTCQLGMTSIILVYFEAYYLYKKQKQNKFLYSVMLLLIIISIFLTGKRILSLIAVAGPLVVYVLSDTNINRKRRNIIIGAIGIIFCFGIFLANLETLSTSRVFGRIANSFLGIQRGDDISSNRNELSALALEAFKQSPAFGVGVNQFRVVTGAYTDVHNSFLQVLCEQGVIGLLFLLIPMIRCYLKTVSVLKSNEYIAEKSVLKFSLFIQTVFILYSFTGNTIIDRHCFIIYFVSIGVLSDFISQNIERK